MGSPPVTVCSSFPLECTNASALSMTVIWNLERRLVLFFVSFARISISYCPGSVSLSMVPEIVARSSLVQSSCSTEPESPSISVNSTASAPLTTKTTGSMVSPANTVWLGFPWRKLTLGWGGVVSARAAVAISINEINRISFFINPPKGCFCESISTKKFRKA